MTTFTQGPWAVTGQAGYTGHGVSAGSKRICSINSNSALPKEQRDANARLLAAAPAMLAALRGISRNAALDDAWLTPVLAAIETATGGTV